MKPDWLVVKELMLSNFAKMQMDARTVQKEDITWCGKLYQWNKKYDRVTTRAPKSLPLADNVAFFNPSTSVDETLEAIMEDDDTIEVVATDNILACLMAAGRSVYSWDIIIRKGGNKV